MRWAIFCLFWVFYAIAGFELTLALDGLSDGLGFSVGVFVVMSLLAASLLMAVWRARAEGVGVLAWVERVLSSVVLGAKLAGATLIVLGLDFVGGRLAPDAVTDAASMISLVTLATFCDAG